MALAPGLRSFTFNLTDLDFIASQIAFQPLFYKSSLSNTGFTPVINWDGVGAVYASTGELLSPGGVVAGDPASLAAIGLLGTSYNSYTDISGVRDVTGNYNNLLPGQSTWGATNQVFARTAAADFKHYVDQAVALAASSSTSTSVTSVDSNLSTQTIAVNVPGVGAPPISHVFNDLSYSPSATGSNHFIDLLNFEASFPDLIAAYGNNQKAMQDWYNKNQPVEHRVASFNGLDYIASYTDLIAGYKNGTASQVQDSGASHFITNGLNEHRTTTFNGLDYLASYSDLLTAYGANNDAGAYHFIEHGLNEHRTTSFDGLSYIAQYTDLMKGYGSNEQAGAAHYIQHGFGEHRTTAFDVAGYFAAHPALLGRYANADAFLTAYIDQYSRYGTFLSVPTSLPLSGQYSVSYNSLDRTVTVTEIATTDHHHLAVNTNTVTTTKTFQTYTVDMTGEHPLGLPTITTTAPSVATNFLSGGELDPLYHAGLQTQITAASANGFAMNDYNPNKSVVDYTPRMISETITSGGHVTYDAKGHYVKGDGIVLLHDASNHIVYWDGTPAMAALLATYSYDSLKTIDTSGLVLGSAIVDTTVPLMANQPDGLGANGAAGHTGLNDGNVYSGAGYGELSVYGQHDKQNTDANNITGHGNHEYFYGNIASIAGNAPNNGFMALFGQFFDHGLDFIGKSDTNAGGHTVKITIPLAVNDPLYGVIGQDGKPTTSITINRSTVGNHWVHDAAGNVLDGHDLAHSVLNAAGNALTDALGAPVSTAGQDGIWGTADDITAIGADHKITGATLGATSPTYINHTSPYIDQSQTYGSVSDVTELLREWVQDPNTGAWIPGAKLYDGQQTVQYTDAFGNATKNTLPTLNELRAAVVATDRTALTWEDVTQDLRHRDAHGHVAYFNSVINPITQTTDEVAYLDVNGVAHWTDPTNVTPVNLAGLHTVAGGEPLLLDMNPNVDGAHLLSSAAVAAIATLNASIGAIGTFANIGGVITLSLNAGAMGPNSPAATFTGVSALAPWVSFADFSIQKSLFGAPGPIMTDAQHAAIGEILMDSVGDHYIAGDGRANENFGLTSIHQAFHEEHGFQVVNIENAIRHQDMIATNLDATNNHGTGNGTPSDLNHAILHAWQDQVAQKIGDAVSGGVTLVGTHYENAAGDYTDKAGNISWNQEKLFTGAKMTVEMEYQHAAVDQYARAVTPDIQEFAGYTSAKNGAISLEYGQAAFRFGHSTLRDTIDTMDPNGGITGKIMSFALEKAFLNPAQFAKVGAGAVILGSTHQLMNEVDQFATPSLNEGLLGQPLDLAAINIARGRDVGLPTLNAFKAASGIGTAYSSWNDFQANMIHPERLVDFVAAYSFDGNLDKAQTILDLNAGNALSVTEQAIVTANPTWNQTFAHNFLAGQDAADGVNHVDLWIGGLAEVHVAGGILGETFNAIFVNQIENLMDGDRLYYLQRLVNQDFGNEIQNEQLKDIFERTTGTKNLNGNVFTYADHYYDEAKNARIATQDIKDPTKLTDLYDDAARVHKVYDATTNTWIGGLPAGIGTTVHLTDVWGNAVVDLYKDNSAAASSKVFDAATMTWLDASYAIGAKSLYFSDGSYIGALQNKYGSLITENQTSVAVNSAFDITDPNKAIAVTDNGLGTVVGDLVNTGIGIYSGDDASTAASGTIAAHTIMLKYGDESTAGQSHTIKFNQNYIFDARPTGTTTNLDGSVDTGTNSAEVMVGTKYDDYLKMGIGDDTAYGGDGNDVIYGGQANAGHNTIYGGAGNDFLVGGDAPDLIDGGSGDDWIFGQSSGSSVNGIDQLIGGSGNDHIFGGIGIDKMFGGTGDDYMYGGQDTDPFMFGGDGNDYMNGGSGSDILHGGNGDDILDGGPGVDQLFGGNGDDILRPGDIADVAGNGGGGDVLIGGDATTNSAGASTDTGFDFADYSTESGHWGLVGDLANQAAVGTLPADKTPLPAGVPRATNIGDVWSELEGIIGTKNDDHLYGDSAADPSATAVSHGNNYLIGGSGNDVLEGRGGNDVIIGGSIRLDSLNGVYTSATNPADAYRAANDYTENAEGATHRIYDDATLGHTSLIDAANANAYGVTFQKHLTVLQQSRAYKDYVLGDNASLADASTGPVTDNQGGNDTAVFGGTLADYSVTTGNAATAHQGSMAYEIIHDKRAVDATGILLSDATGLISGDGTDLVAGVSFFQFSDQKVSVGNIGGHLDILQATPGATNPFGAFTATLSGVSSSTGTTIAWQNVGGTFPTAGVTVNGATLTIDNTVSLAAVQTYDAIATVNDPLGFVSTFTSGELIIGTTGNDILSGGNGNNIIYGLAGDDTLIGGAGNDLLYGGDGNDTAVFTGTAWASTAALRGGVFTMTTVGGGTDTLSSIENVRFGTSDYVLSATMSNAPDTVVGTNVASYIEDAGTGTHTINAGTSDDVIVWTATGTNAGNAVLDGRDIVDGGAKATARGNTFVVNGDAEAETFNVYSNTDLWDGITGSVSSAAHAGLTGLNSNTKIVITRNGADNAHIIGELQNIEEIQINTGGAIAAGIDHVNVIGNFTGTNLNSSTITVVDQGTAQAVVDVSLMASPEHIALYSTGGGDKILGQRSQDQILDNTALLPAHTLGTGGPRHIGSTVAMSPVVAGTPTAPVDQHLTGDAGANVLTGGDGNNTITGLAGDDLITVGNGNNSLFGGAGDDTIVAGNGNNHVYGGAGNDTIILGNGTNWVSAGTGDDNVFGGTGHTTFVDTGNDGNDSYYGGGASDTLDMSAVAANIQANLGTGTAGWAKVGTEVNHLYSIENITTGLGDDTITASDAHNTIDVGGHTATGHDTVIFGTAASADGDNILNFQAGDKLDVHGMMNGTIHLVSHATVANDIAVQFDATTHGNSIVTGIDEGGNHFTLDVKGHHVIGMDFAA